jgi:hypothetical protein
VNQTPIKIGSSTINFETIKMNQHYMANADPFYSDVFGKDVDDLDVWNSIDSSPNLWNESSWKVSGDVGKVPLSPVSPRNEIWGGTVPSKKETFSHYRRSNESLPKKSKRKSSRKKKKKKKELTEDDGAETKGKNKTNRNKHRRSTQMEDGQESTSTISVSNYSFGDFSTLPSPGAQKSPSPRKEKKRLLKHKRKSRMKKHVQSKEAELREVWGFGCVSQGDVAECVEAIEMKQKSQMPLSDHRDSGTREDIAEDAPSKEGGGKLQKQPDHHNRTMQEDFVVIPSKNTSRKQRERNLSPKRKKPLINRLARRRSPRRSPGRQRSPRPSQLTVKADGSYRKTLPRDQSSFKEKKDQSETRRGSIRRSIVGAIGDGEGIEASLAMFLDSSSSHSETELKTAEKSVITAETEPLVHSGAFSLGSHNSNVASSSKKNGASSSRKRRKPRKANNAKLKGFFF